MLSRKAFVTGGSGFIGSHIVDRLLEDPSCSVTVYDNLSTGQRQFLQHLAGNPRFQLIEADVLDLNTLQTSMKDHDIVFHMQANADVRGGMKDTRRDLDQNIIGTWNVLESMKLNSVPRIVFASSATVYGEPNVFPTPESVELKQTSLYGASKLAGEALIQAYSSYFGIKSYIFRFVSWIGERYSHGVIFDFANKLASNPNELEILGNGHQKKSYLYVKDGVSGIFRALEKASDSVNTFNLGHDDYMEVLTLARIVSEELGLPNVKFKTTGGERGWVGDSPLVHLSTENIKRLGWRPETSIEAGIRHTVRYLKENSWLLKSRA